MSVVFILVFAAIVMAGGFLGAFIWSVRNDQYEDTYTPSVRILFDDPPVKEAECTEQKEKVKPKGIEHGAESMEQKPENGKR